MKKFRGVPGRPGQIIVLVALITILGIVYKFAFVPHRRELLVQYKTRGRVFERWELLVTFPKELDAFNHLPDTQVHDAYDANRDGIFLRLAAEFRLNDEHTIIVPGFAMKKKPGGPWCWRVRWAPDRPGEWSVTVRFAGRPGWTGKVITVAQKLKKPVHVQVVKGIDGPLVAPGKGQHPGYLRRLRPDGTSQALWLFGACRAWVVNPSASESAAAGKWDPDEWLDRETELFTPMREGGFNLLNQWMAPWEFLLVHHDRAEFWRQPGGSWQREPLPMQTNWSAYQCYDQGRARAFDRLVSQCEGGPEKSTIHLLLAPLSHHSLQMRGHPWGWQESGWSPWNDAGRQTLDRLNGFSGFKRGMSVWDFFAADPGRPSADWRAQLFDHQANFFRYVIARWGYSRALGVWVLVDELDGVGDELGVMADKTGWWAHPQCDRWLANMVRLFRGELVRADGLRYGGDPFHHPLHAAATSSGGQAERGGNLDWPGGPPGARPDLLGWHWYPYYWEDTWSAGWAYAIDGVKSFSLAPVGKRPRLISEFGAPDRYEPDDEPSWLYPTMYHHAIWAAVFAGQAGTPMDWDDGKEFGELRWRNREGVFDRKSYPIDHVAQVKALRRFLAGLSPEDLHSTLAANPKIKCEAAGALRLFALYSGKEPRAVYGWLFSLDGQAGFTISGLAPGKYRLGWYDPWTGAPVPKESSQTLSVAQDGVLKLDGGPVLKELRRLAKPFPEESRLDRGRDLAFKLEPVGGE